MSESAVPLECTLAPGQMMGRLAEFEELFGGHLVALDREPERLRLVFDADATVEAAARDLFAREQQCCAFFAFGYGRDGGRFTVLVEVPAGAGPTLDGLQTIADRSAPQVPRTTSAAG